MGMGGQYTIRVHGMLDDTQIRAQLGQIQAQMGKMAIGGGASVGKGANGIAAVGKEANRTAAGVRRLNAAVDTTGKSVKKIEGKKLAGAYTGVSKGAKQATSNVKTFGSTTLDVTKKVVQFGAVTAAIRGVTTGMGAMVQQTFQLDSALTEFKKVSDLSGKGLENYTKQAYEAGKATAKTGVEMIDAATQFRKMGYGDQQSMQLAKYATMFQNIADAEISAGDAAKFINSQMKAYQGEFKSLGSEGEKAAKVIDTVNEVANKNAVGTNDLQLALTKTSAAMGGFGNSFDQVVGIMTAGTEIMVGMPSQVARGWRTIGANILQVAQSSDEYVAASGKVKIATRDQNGEMKNTYDMMRDLYTGIDGVSVGWKELSKEEQSAIALQLAGKNNMEKFRAVMDNFATAIKASDEAQRSQGSAMKENARYMDSLQGRLQALKSAWSRFSNAMVKSDTVKVALEGLTKTLEFFTTDFGQAMIKGTLGLLGLGAGLKLVSGLFSLALSPLTKMTGVLGSFGKTASKVDKPLGKVGKNIKVMQKPLAGGAKSAGTAATRFALLGSTFSGLASLLMSPAGLIAGMLALGAGIMYVNTKLNKAKSPEKQYKKTHDELGKLEKKYDEVGERIDELNKKREREGLTSSEEAELGALEREREEIHKNIEAYKELEKAQMNAHARTPDKKVEKTDKVKQHQRPVTKASPLGANLKQAQKDAGATDLLTSKMVIYEDAAKKVAEAERKVADAREKSVKAAQSGDADKMAKAEENLSKALKEQEGARKGLTDSLKDMAKENESLKKFYGSQERMPDDIRKSSKAVDKLLASYDNLKKLKEKGGAKGVDFMGLSGASLDKTISDFKTLGQSIGLAVDESGKLASVDFDTMSSGLQEMGYSADEARSALMMIAETHPEARVNVSGVEVAGKDVATVLDYLDKVDGNDPEATININGTDVAVSDITSVEDLASRLNGTKFEPIIETKGGEKAKDEFGSVEESGEEIDGAKFVGKILMKGGEKSKDEVESVVESGDELNGSKYTGKVEMKGGEKAAESAKTAKDAGEGLNGRTFSSTLQMDGASEVAEQASTAQNAVASIPTTRQTTLAANTKGAVTNLQQVKTKQDAIKTNKTATITAKKSGEGAWSSLKSLWSSIKSKVVTITGKKVGDFAKGTRNAPEGLAEVNEQGWEFIRDAKTGKLRIAGGGKRTVTLLSKGDAVYTHEESKRMLSDARSIEIPQHKKGKKGKKSKKKKQTTYNKKYNAIESWYENELKKAEHTKEMKHYSDKWLADKQKALRTQAENKLKALNKQKISGKGKLTKKGALSQDIRFEQEEAMEEALHDIATKAVENMLEGSLGTAKDLQDTIEEINKQSSHLSEEEKEKYLKEAYKNNLEYTMKQFQLNKTNYSDMKKLMEDYYKDGKITVKEYYEYLDELMEEQLEKQKKALEKIQQTTENTYSLASSWIDRQIERLEKQNEETDEQNELIEKQNDLEKARTQRVKVYRQGKGFVYEQDTQAIKEATSALKEYKKEQESPELKAWREVKDLFDDLEASAEIANLERLVGGTFEELFGGYGTDLSKWTSFIKENLATKYGYENLLEEMEGLEGWEAIQDFLDATGVVSREKIEASIAQNRFATGTLSAPAGFARVAENGYEIALLGQGDAVMPHGVSENLMAWGAHSPIEYASAVSEGANSQVYNFDSLVLPNVTNADSFIRELNDLPNRALQYSRGRA